MFRRIKPKNEADSERKEREGDQPKAGFRLESLEPRILLSGDPVLAELARLSQPDTQSLDEPAALVEVIELATGAPQASDADQVQGADSDATMVSWPAGWPTAEPDSATDDTAIDSTAGDTETTAATNDIAAIPVTDFDEVDADEMAEAIAADNVALHDLNPDFDDLVTAAATGMPTASASISNAAGRDLNPESDPVATPILDRTDPGMTTDFDVVNTPAATPHSSDSTALDTSLSGTEIGSDQTADSSNAAQQNDATDIVVGLFATTQQAREMARSELRRTVNNGHENRTAWALSGARASQTQIPLSQEIHNESLARAPPVIAEIQTVSAISAFDTIREERVEPSFVASETPVFPDTDTELPHGPVADDAQPRAPPAQPEPLEFLLVDGAPILTGSADSLTADQLDAIFQAALQIWSDFLKAAGLTGDNLDSIQIQIGDLAGAILGQSQGYAITIDLTAAGYGWFVDATPHSNAEFDVFGSGQFGARLGGEAQGRIDLLTVVLHEIGHVLGLGHELSNVGKLMDDTLAAGQRITLDSLPDAAALHDNANLKTHVTPVDFGIGVSITLYSAADLSDLQDLLDPSGTTNTLTFIAEIQVNHFVYLVGSFTIVRGADEVVDIGTGIPANIPLFGTWGSTISNETVSVWTLSANDVYAFVGFSIADQIDANEDMVIDEADLTAAGAAGFLISDLDAGAVLMNPDTFGIPLLFALRATAASAKIVGMDSLLKAEAVGINLEVNTGGTWPGGFGPPAVDFAASFPGGFSVNGFEFNGLDGNQRIGLELDYALVSLANFLHMEGSFGFEKGPQMLVDLGTGVPQNLGPALQTAWDAAILAADALYPGDFVADILNSTVLTNNGGTLTDIDVSGFVIGADNVNAFIGFGLDTSSLVIPATIPTDPALQPLGALLASPPDHLFGFSVQGLDIGIAVMEPTINDFLPGNFQIPSFIAGRAHIDSFDFLDGGLGLITVSGRGLDIDINHGDNWMLPGIPEFGPAVIDWAASFESAPNAGDGEFEIPTGGTPVVLDYDGNQRIGVTLDYGLVSLFDFMHMEGSFGFEMGPQMLVDLGTGVPQNLGPALQTAWDAAIVAADAAYPGDFVADILGTTVLTNNGGTLTDIDVSGFVVGASNVNAFIGFGLDTSSIVIPTNTADRPLGALLATAPDYLFGFSVQGLDIGVAMMDPTINDFLPSNFQIPSFVAGRAHIDSFEFLDGGLNLITVVGRGLDIDINDGDNWALPGIPEFGPAVIDWASSFTELGELAPFDTNEDGLLNTADGLPAFLSNADLVINGGDGNGIVTRSELLTLYDTDNDGQLEFVDDSLPSGFDDYDADDNGVINGLGFYVPTGADPVVLDYDGNQRNGVTLDYGLVSLINFLHMEGTFGFEKGPQMLVDLGTGVPQNLGPALQTAWNAAVAAADAAYPGDFVADILGTTALTNNGGTLTDVDVSGFVIGASNVNAFIGFGLQTSSLVIPTIIPTDPALQPLGALLATPPDYLFGFSVQGLDIGVAVMEPTINDFLPGFDIPSFVAGRATIDSFDFLDGGLGLITVAGRGLEIIINDGDNWMLPPIPEFGPAVIDWAASFPELGELVPFDTDEDGVLETADGLPAFLSNADLVVNGGDGNGIVTRAELLALYDIDGDGQLEFVDDGLPSGFDDYDADNNGVINGLGFYVPTGGDPIVLDYDGNQRIGVTLEYGLVSLVNFLHMEGTFGFEMGPQMLVDLGTGVPQDLGPALQAAWDAAIVAATAAYLPGDFVADILGTTALTNNGGTLLDVDVSGFVIGASNVNAFIGFGLDTSSLVIPTTIPTDPALQPLGALLADPVLRGSLFGFAVEGLDIGVAVMEPTINDFLPGFEIPSFVAGRATIDSFEFLDGGLGIISVAGRGLEININHGDDWDLAGIEFGPAVIDWASSFSELGELLPFDADEDGVLHTANDALPTFLSDADIAPFGNGDGIVTRQELLALYDTDGDGQLELVDDSLPSDFDGYDADGNGVINGLGFYVPTGGEPVVLDYDGNARLGLSVERATFQISQFVYITGGFAFEKGPQYLVNLVDSVLPILGSTTALLNALPNLSDILSAVGLPDVSGLLPLADGNIDVSGMTFGATNVHAFVGIGGPYWLEDFDDSTTVGNGDDVIDADEINHDAVGLVVDDFDFGLAILLPTLADFVSDSSPFKYLALRASASGITLVGIDGVTVTATEIIVELNISMPTIYGISLLPVIDFDSSFPDELLTLGDGMGLLQLSELTGFTAPTGLDADGSGDLTYVEMLAYYDAIANGGDGNGQLELSEVPGVFYDADVDNDGKIDPVGFEVNTGGIPQYLAMDSYLIRAQGFLELNLLNSIFLTGSVAFELGPTETVTLSDSTVAVPNTQMVTTMSIGAANVTGFIGSGGPYWTDTDGDHVVDNDELNANSIGFHITDLDFGILLMASVADISVYLAGKLNVNSFGLVGVDDLTAVGAFDIELNLGFGLSGFDPSFAVVDFDASFNEVNALFDLIDSSNNGVIETAELNNVLNGGYTGPNVSTYEQLVSTLNIGGAPSLGGVPISDLLNALSPSFLTTANVTAINAADADRDDKLDFGFEVNTGDPTSPVVLDFEQFLLRVQLGGEIEYTDVFRMYGVFLFEIDPTGLRAFVAAGLEFGPDIDSSDGSKLFAMNALGALVINSAGIAADIDISASVGGALSSVLNLNVSARLVFNTTDVAQTIDIPAQYVNFLTGGSGSIEDSLPASELFDTAQLNDLTGPLDSRFTLNGDGSATFTISAGAPSFDGQFNALGAPTVDGGFDAAGDYFLVVLHGDLTIASAFVLNADFRLLISAQGLELGFNGTIDLDGFATLDADGGAIIEGGNFAAYARLALNVNVAGVIITGGADFEINSGNSSATVFDALGNPHQITANTFRVNVDATIDLFGVLTATGSVEFAVVGGNFSIDVDATINFFDVVNIDIDGYFNSNGTFSFTGSLILDLTEGSGALEFGIDGGLSVTVSNSGFSGHGEVGLVIFGENINIASATVSVNWDTGDWLIRAEGPLSVWLEVTSNPNFPYFSLDGGLGVLDAVFEALGDAAVAVGEAVVAAAEAVADAFEDLGEAILDFGADVLDFVGGILTDLGDLFAGVFDDIAQAFSGSRTRVIDLTDDIVANFSYNADVVNNELIIDNVSADRLAVAIVNGQIIVDAPDVTASVVVARRVDEERDFDSSGWPWEWGWGPWYEVSSTDITRTITFSNTTGFTAAGITKIVINGINIAETIIIDRASVSIDAEVHGRGGDDIIVTGQGNDLVYGGTGNDTIFTYEGNDVLHGGANNDKLFGGLGNDELYGESGEDYLDENKDRTDPLTTTSETNLLDGGSEDDILLGSPGKDHIEGGGGNDVLAGMANDDTYVFLDGYGTDLFADYYGIETLDFSGSTNDLDVLITATGLTAAAGTGNFLSIDNLVLIEELRLGSGDDDVYMSRLPNILFTITDAGGRDLVTVDDTGDPLDNVGILTSTRLTGLGMGNPDQTVVEPGLGIAYSDIEDLVISLGDGDNVFTINSTHGGGTKTTTLNTGDGTDLVHINNASDTLVVNGQGAVDTMNLNGTSASSMTTLNGDDGDDIFNLRALTGDVDVNGGNDSDTFNVGSLAPAGNSVLTGIGGLLTINGNDPTSGSDVLNVDDTGDIGRTGTLTDATITGLGMPGSIAYYTIETLNIGLGGGVDTFTVEGTHAGITNLNSNDGADIINVQTIGGTTTVNTGDGADNVNVGSNALGTTTNRTNNSNGTLNGIDALLTLNGEGTGSELDVLTVDDSADNVDNTGVLTGTRLTGLGMGDADQSAVNAALGIDYSNFEQLVVSLGIANDTFTIVTTHNVATAAVTELTTLNAGPGADTVHIDDVRDTLVVNGQDGIDTINVNGTDTISLTTLNGDANNDIFNVRAMNGEVRVNGGANDDTVNVGSLAAAIPGAPTTPTGTIDQINGLLVVNGTSGDLDVLNVDDSNPAVTNKSGTLTNNRIDGLELEQGINYSNLDVLNIWLASGENNFVINSTHAGETTVYAAAANDTIDINNAHGLLTVNGEAGMDTINVYNLTGTLVVNGQGDVDTVNVYGTETASLATLNGDDGNDVFNVRAMNGEVRVNGGANDDTINVGSLAPAIPGTPTTATGTIDQINGLLVVNGTDGDLDVLNVDDSNPDANTAKSGTLTSTRIEGLELEQGIIYSNLDVLNIWLASGDNTFVINSTHDAVTNVNAAEGDDRVDVNGASGLLTINGEAGDDDINIRATGLNSEVRVFGQGGVDTINISDATPTLPSGFPASRPPPAADTVGNIDGVDGLVSIDGGDGIDQLNIDDSANTAAKYGTLTENTLRGLAMPAGINYSDIQDLNLWLGSGADVLYIASTHIGTTQVYAGDGNETLNERDDTIAINSISGVTTIRGQAGNDFIEVNVDSPTLPQDGTFASLDPITDFFVRTHLNGVGALLNLHGDGASDQYTVNLAGEGVALINVLDFGAHDDGVDTLIINGADVVTGLANQPDDTFLLRRDFVALLNESVANAGFDQVERVNYDENINARLIVNGLGGDDEMYADNNSAVMTLDGGDGDDYFQIGQVFSTPRDANANIADPDDYFDTTAVIIGVVRDVSGNVIFNPAEDTYDQTAINTINAAIVSANGTPLSGIAYVSNGVNQATTVFGGDGEDKFSVYRNVGTLRLEGEAGNDEFVVRAFVVLGAADAQGGTNVNGGAGEDLIQYAINAPVSIDGGLGFDKIVVLGTPFPDNFVVASYGIFGAGLNVRFENVESAELDTLEGDDVVYILSTSADLVTTVIGGLGNDRIEVLGDVVSRIVSNDLLGRSGLVTHGFTSGGLDWTTSGVNGLVANVISAADGSLVDISQAGEPLLVTEDGLVAQYQIMLTADPLQAVYLTVSAGTASLLDQSLDGASILVSTDGINYTNAVVLTFTAANTPQTIWVKAIDDLGLEGERLVLVSHSINSADPAYDDLAVRDALVRIVDNDLPMLDIRQYEDVNGTPVPDFVTEVLEGVDGFTDIYQFALTAAPAMGEMVTVTLLLPMDAQVTLSQYVFVFTHLNWNQIQTVTITAIDDPDPDGVKTIRITHQMTSSLGAASLFHQASEAYQELDVTVYDNETAGAIIRQSDGSTVVVEREDGNVFGGFDALFDDSYRVRLTRAPDANTTVTLTLMTDSQTLLFSLIQNDPRFTVVSQTGTQFEYTVTFDDGNWDDWYEVGVTANVDFVGGDTDIKVFAPESQNLDRIQGPLIIEGGVLPGSDRSLAMAMVLPGETNVPVGQESPLGDESQNIDILNIYHTDNNDTDTGALVYRDTVIVPVLIDGVLVNTAFQNQGYALTGYEMGGLRVFNEGTTDNPIWVSYGGGITYGNFEIFELLLGKGNESLDIFATADDSITAVHGGGGDDTITIYDRGNGPLLIYGDTSEDRLRYANDTGGVSASGTSFSNDGNDVIDASAMADQNDGYVGVVIYGGPGNDTITGSQDDDQLAGGAGSDTINGEGGNDHIYGDSHFNIDLMLFARDRVTPFADTDPEVGQMFVVLVTTSTDGVAGEDIIDGGDDDDTIFGDHGIITQTVGTRRIETTGFVERVETTENGVGAADTINGGAGNDIILGSQLGDTINGDEGHNIIFGDHGYVDYVNRDGDLSDIDEIFSTSVTDFGGIDIITAGSGDDIVIGGRFGDTINAGDGANLVFGDHGQIIAAVSDAGNYFAGLPITLGLVQTIESLIGGLDNITTGSHTDIVFGGISDDWINAGDGNNIVFGDSGYIDWTANEAGRVYNDTTTALAGTLVGDDTDASDIDRIVTTQPNDGGSDTIISGNGNDLIIGGTAGDVITAGAGNDLVFGDHAMVVAGAGGGVNASDLPLASTFIFVSIYTQTSDAGGNDVIFGQAGNDILIGQQGNDRIYGGDDDDDIIGGHNVVNGADTDDRIDGGAGNDVIAGDNASVLRSTDGLSPLIRVLQGTLIYDLDDNVLVTSASQVNPTGADARTIVLFNHSATEAAGTFGNDYIAGGGHDDLIFGQLGNDIIQGDGAMADDIIDIDGSVIANPAVTADVAAYRDNNGLLVVSASFKAATDGDDYIEGGGGTDIVFGNLGQDDIIGGSSDLFGLATSDLRPDGSDLLFGGAGTDIGRNDLGDVTLVNGLIVLDANGHSRDSDMILGDNGRILRLIDASGNFLEFNYDQNPVNPGDFEDRGDLRIIVRAAHLLDYTPGGPDFDPTSAATDIGAADEIHGESGDDFIYGQVGNDVLFGEGQSDDLIGGWGHDWISGGVGIDGVIGDDGRIYTSRNSLSEPLYGLAAVFQEHISTPGNIQSADINITFELAKAVNLTPFNVDGSNPGFQNNLYDPLHADDVIYGGLGGDFLHGGAGDDAMSGAEALPEYYAAPFNPGNLLRWGEVRAGEFAAYDEFNPRRHILVNADGVFTDDSDPTAREFLLNFLADDPSGVGLANVSMMADGTLVYSDGDDVMFGDLGNDWLVGGTGRDHLFGGRGDDLHNIDDDHGSTSGTADPRANDVPDTDASYEDIAYGGAGRDILIANTGGDRMIDWAGEFNSYLVPFAAFGNFTISRSLQPQLMQFLYDLSAADGADPTRAADTGADASRNGEPEGEIGLVKQQDADWQDQTGAPDDPQPGNIPGGPRDVLRGADFNNGNGNNGNSGNNGNGQGSGFAADSGSWVIVDGRLQIAPEFLGGDAVSVFYVDSVVPSYFEMVAIINAGIPTGGLKSNAYFVFDYQSATDFKFAGVNISTNKIQIGHYSATDGWVVDVQTPSQLSPNTDYHLLLSINGNVATLVVDNDDVLSFAFQPRVDMYGVSHGLNGGMVGLGAKNSIARVDNLFVQILPPEITLEQTESFDDGLADWFANNNFGDWQVVDGRYIGLPTAGDQWGHSMIDLSVRASYLLQVQATFSTTGTAGIIFDQYGPNSFKFVAISALSNELLIGHYTDRHGWRIDTSLSVAIEAGQDYSLDVTLRGTTISVTLDGQVILGYVFNGLVVDGSFGLFTQDGQSSFDTVTRITNDPDFLSSADNNAPTASGDNTTTMEDTPLIIDASVLLGNDSDPDGDLFDISSFSQPQYGMLIDNGNGTFTYTPGSNFHGTDNFSYTINDGNGGFSTAVVTIAVTSVNDLPTAGDDAFVINRNSVLVIDANALLGNDGDIDGDSLTIIDFSQPLHGSLVLNVDGSYSYTPLAGFHGLDSFSYTVSDGNGGSVTAQVSITVRAGGGNKPIITQPIVIPDLGGTWAPVSPDPMPHRPFASPILSSDSSGADQAATPAQIRPNLSGSEMMNFAPLHCDLIIALHTRLIEFHAALGNSAPVMFDAPSPAINSAVQNSAHTDAQAFAWQDMDRLMGKAQIIFLENNRV